MAELSVSSDDRTKAEAAAEEIAQALTEGASELASEDTVEVSPAFVSLALADPPTLDLAKNTFKAMALGILRQIGTASVPSRATPAGSIDGVNDTFTVPANTFLLLFVNGALRSPGTHYDLSGGGNSTLVYAPGYIPDSGDVHEAIYW